MGISYPCSAHIILCMNFLCIIHRLKGHRNNVYMYMYVEEGGPWTEARHALLFIVYNGLLL